MARSVHRHRARLSPVSKLYPGANLFEPPPPYSGRGRPPVKGPRRPRPSRAVARATLKTEEVAWYGGGRRVAVIFPRLAGRGSLRFRGEHGRFFRLIEFGEFLLEDG